MCCIFSLILRLQQINALYGDSKCIYKYSYIYKRSTAALDAYSIYTQCVSTPCFASETNEIFRYTTAALGHMVGRTYLDLEKTGSVPA